MSDVYSEKIKKLADLAVQKAKETGKPYPLSVFIVCKEHGDQGPEVRKAILRELQQRSVLRRRKANKPTTLAKRPSPPKPLKAVQPDFFNLITPRVMA